MSDHPALDRSELELHLASRRDTRRLAAALAALLAPGDVVWLEGDLGAGKTFFARGLLRGLGVPESIPVTSPTFALVHEHAGRLPIRHLDLYRLGSVDEVHELGLDEALEASVTIIEWGQRLREGVGARGIELELGQKPVDKSDRAPQSSRVQPQGDVRSRAKARRRAATPRMGPDRQRGDGRLIDSRSLEGSGPRGRVARVRALDARGGELLERLVADARVRRCARP